MQLLAKAGRGDQDLITVLQNKNDFVPLFSFIEDYILMILDNNKLFISYQFILLISSSKWFFKLFFSEEI